MISKVYNRYPKSIIISLDSCTGAQKARKLSILHTEPEVRTEEPEEQEKKEEREGEEEWKQRDETTKGKEAPADKGKKLRRDRLIFRKEGTKGFFKAGYIV